MKSGDPSRLTAFALGLTRYAPRGANLVVGVLLIEIEATFGLPLAVANQLNTVHSLLSLATTLAMGVLSVRFSMEGLLFAGLGLALVSAAGSLFAPSFPLLLFLYSLNGAAWCLIHARASALNACGRARFIC